VRKTILIAPFEGSLAEALAAEARAAGWSVALALPAAGEARDSSGDGAAEGSAGGGPEVCTLSYSPASFVSVSAMVLAARNALGELDAAAIVHDPASAPDLAAARPGEMAAFAEARCAGPLFLSREIVRLFEARKGGSLLLLAPESPRDSAQGPAAALAAGAFEGLGRGLFAAASSSDWRAYGLLDSGGQGDRAARFALALLAQERPAKSGRWLRFSGKAGIFG